MVEPNETKNIRMGEPNETKMGMVEPNETKNRVTLLTNGKEKNGVADDFNDSDVPICGGCGDAINASELLQCEECKRWVGKICCAQTMYCQSNECTCFTCNDLPTTTIKCSVCEQDKPAAAFELIQMGEQIVLDSGECSMLCDGCANSQAI